ncbi:tetratricopeptide repeat protein [Sorangium sp. So ce117]|uniref:tetratricopeptide repeat protein n=1 Tax=Sorangium sp. So ce117 TaxID=3133277 RepID=UPI003F5E751B
MSQQEYASREFRRRIGASQVVVRCGADLELQAEMLLDVVARCHEGGTALNDGATVELGDIPFTLRHVGGELVVHEPDFKGSPPRDAVPGADQALRILNEQEAVVKRVGAKRSSAPLRALVRMEKSGLRSLRVCLRRMVPSDPQDSGWTIGALRDLAGTEEAIVMTTVSEIFRVRPWLGKVLTLPAGYRAVLDFHSIESIEDDTGEHVWIIDPLMLAHLSRSALKERRLADLDRTVNALLESTTTEIESLRPLRQLARRWGGGPWMAYANALTTLTRLKHDDDKAVEVRSLVEDLCTALSPGGGLAGEEAPSAITENFTTLYRHYWRVEAAEVLEGLLAPGSGQHAALLFQRAVLASDAGDYAGTVEALRRSVAIEPRSPTLWFLLGTALLEASTLEETPTVLLDPAGEIVEAFDRALTLLDVRDTLTVDHCVRALDHRYLRADWTLVDLLRKRTVALRDVGRLDEALASADRLVAAAPDEPRSWEILGTVLFELSRHDDVINAYTAAIECSVQAPPEHSILAGLFASPWYNRAAVYALLGQRAEAVADLRQALAVAPSWAEAVLFDERFKGLTADGELQRLVEEGRAAAQACQQQNLDDGKAETGTDVCVPASSSEASKS